MCIKWHPILWCRSFEVLIDLSHEFTFRYDIFGFSGAYWSGTESKDLRLCGTYDPFPEEEA